jgi:mono/diheme cytochrome c family protein
LRSIADRCALEANVMAIPRRALLFGPLHLLAVAGCGSDAASPSSGGTTYADVAPIFAKNCVGCHQPGSIAPFALTSYEDAHLRGPRMREVTEQRIMPPWLPESSGACQTYRDQTWLSDKDIRTIGKWVEAGMPPAPEGYVPPEPLVVPTLEGVANHVAQMPVEYTPDATLADDYRCFIFDSDVTSDTTTYITEYEFVPGDRRVVHHLIASQVTSQAAADQARALDDADSAPGYSCFGATGVSARMLMNWSPGSGVVKLPEGTALSLDPHLPLVVQIHYNLSNGSFPDRTSVRMKTVDQIDHPVSPWFFANPSISLEPKKESIETSFEVAAHDYPIAPTAPAVVIGVRAHMHLLGRSSRIEKVSVDPSTGEEVRTCLVDIPRYDYHWQRSYFLNDAVPLMPDDKLSLSCTYSTVTKDTVTTWGEGTSDEMCLATFYTYLQ